MPYYVWPEYHLPLLFHRSLQPRAVPGGLGVEIRYWPFLYQKFVGDAVPADDSSPHNRWYLSVRSWQPITRQEPPAGWYRALFRIATSKYAVSFSRVEQGQDYRAQWSKVARYDQRKFASMVAEGKLAVETLTWEEFERAYRGSTVARKMGRLYLRPIAHRLKTAPATAEHMRIFGVRNKMSGNEVVAGMLVFDSPTFKSSFYYAGFYHTKARAFPAMVGLMDHWFATSQSAGLHTLQFGNSWIPGNPSDWKGFSQFKTKFGVNIVSLPEKLYQVRFRF